MSRDFGQTSIAWRSGWLLAALIAVAALALVVSQPRTLLAQATPGDIELEKTVSGGIVDDDTFEVGDLVTFTITINNTSDDAVAEDDLTIVDVVAELTDVVATPADTDVYDCEIAGDTVTCSNSEGEHADGDTHTITITGFADEIGSHTNEVEGTLDEDPLESAEADFTIVEASEPVERTITIAKLVTEDEDAPELTSVSGTILPHDDEGTWIIDIDELSGDTTIDDVSGEAQTVTETSLEEGWVAEYAVVSNADGEATCESIEDWSEDFAVVPAGDEDHLVCIVNTFVAEEPIGRSITIEKLVEGDDAPELESVTVTITPHSEDEWIIDEIPGLIVIPGVGDEAQTVIENDPGENWTVTYAVIEDGELCEDAETWTSGAAVVDEGEDNYTVCILNTYEAPSIPDERTYTLNVRWSLLAWLSPDMPIGDALRGEGQNEGGTNVFDDVVAIFAWDGAAQDWLAFFPDGVDVPGANDLETLEFGAAYWIAIEGPDDISWTVIHGEPDDDDNGDNGENGNGENGGDD